ncbi:uncharacterized protein LOC135948235 [Cloeon dipterum]|uniref:uncharacterized protein LOC135948235 n=1 Tax=Cloeon dipterum TaxID=197152 RepID=UPI0032209512
MDLSQAGNHPQRQHQYVNDWHIAPSSRLTASIDLSAGAHRPLAPVYHCNLPAVISQTQARPPSGVIVTANEWPPFRQATPSTTWPTDSRQQFNSSNVADRIYEIPSDDDTLSSDDDRLLIIDENVDSPVEDEIDSNEKGQVDAQSPLCLASEQEEKILEDETKVVTKAKEKHNRHRKFKLKDFILSKPSKRISRRAVDQKSIPWKKVQHMKSAVSSEDEIKQKQRKNEVKARAESPPLNVILWESSKGDKNAELQEEATVRSSSVGLAERSRPAKPEEHKYEQKNSSREQNGKQTTCKSLANKSRKEGESHDSTKNPRKNDERDEMKLHRSETKQDENERKPVLSVLQLCRKFDCEKQVRVLLKRLTKGQIRQHTHPVRPKLARIPKICAAKEKLRKPFAFEQNTVDARLEANTLMNSLLGSTPRADESLKKPKIVFAPRRVIKRRKTAAPPAATPVLEKRKGAVNAKTFPKELIGLIERDIQRAVPLQRFINDVKRHPKIDWIVLDGKMQHSLTQRKPLRRKVKVRVLMPPQYLVQDKIAEYERQMMAREAAIAEFKKKPPMKIKGVASWPKFQVSPCCSEKEKQELRDKLARAEQTNFLKLFPTPRVGLERQQELLPNHWHTKILSTPFQIGKYLLRGVSPLSREFKYVARKFNKSCEQRVLAVDRVENPHLWFRYHLKKEKMELRNPFAQEMHLFHGTDKKFLDSILSYNLTWRYFGRKKGSRFGHGYYFSPLSSYAVHYTDQNPDHSIMLLFRVLTVKQCIGFENSKLPDEGFDTSISENGKVWVKFDVDEVYPDYVIHFAYSDPKEKAEEIGQYRAKMKKIEAERWKKSYRKYLMWSSFRRRLRRRSMSWHKFCRNVKKWKPVKRGKGVKLKAGPWRGPKGRMWTGKPVVATKLKKPQFRSMAVWKQPSHSAPKRKVIGSYRAKKR